MAFILIYLCASIACAQDKFNLKLNNKEARHVTDYVLQMKKTAIHVDYKRISFFNTTYFQNNEDGTIKNKGGANIAIEYRIWIFRLDVGGYYTWYSSDYDSSKAESNFRICGLDAFASFLPMPDLGHISSIIVPFIGVGYQSASLQQTEETKDNKTDVKSSVGLGGPLWKAGVQINLGANFFINGEYKQSLLLGTDKASSAFVVGLGIRW